MAAMLCVHRLLRRVPGNPTRCGGFTLTEVLMVTAIVAVVMTLALPSMAAMLSNQRLSTYASSLLVALQLARNDAVKRGGTTVVCKSSDGSRCVATGHWEQGWIVFEDNNHNAVHDADERLIATQDAAPAGVSIRGNTPVARYVSYNAVGATRMVSGALQAGTFTLCTATSGNSIQPRQVILAVTGRVRIQSAGAGTCP